MLLLGHLIASGFFPNLRSDLVHFCPVSSPWKFTLSNEEMCSSQGNCAQVWVQLSLFLQYSWLYVRYRVGKPEPKHPGKHSGEEKLPFNRKIPCDMCSVMCEGEVKCDGCCGGKWVRGGIKEWMKLKVVSLRGAKREANMDSAREEGQKRCIISRAPPPPLLWVVGAGWQHPLPSFVKLSPSRGEESSNEPSGKAVRITSRGVKESVAVQDSHDSAAPDTSSGRRILAGAHWAVASLLPIIMPSVSLSLPTALAEPARTWICLSCMFWVRLFQLEILLCSRLSVATWETELWALIA